MIRLSPGPWKAPMTDSLERTLAFAGVPVAQEVFALLLDHARRMEHEWHRAERAMGKKPPVIEPIVEEE